MSSKSANNKNDIDDLDPELQEIINAVRQSIDECRAAGITGIDQIHKTVEAHKDTLKRIMDRKKLDEK